MLPLLRVALVVLLASVVLAPGAAQAKSFACRGDDRAGYALRVSLTNCSTGRAVQRVYFNGDGPGTIQARGRSWRCSSKIVKRHGYDPSIFAERITGRVLCTHVANSGRFVRWFFDGGGD